MKYIISESEFEKHFNKYILIHRPELYDLAKDVQDGGNKVYEYQFYNDKNFNLFFKYQFEPFWDNDEEEELPKLILTSKLANELKGLFGNKSKELIKNWFELEYGYPVKTVVFKD